MKRFSLLIFLLITTILANATVYLDETFNYTASDINTQGSWTTAGSYTGGTGYTIGSGSLSYTVSTLAYTLSGLGKSLVNNIGTTATDYKAYKPFNGGTSVSSGVLYLSFLMKANANISSTNQELFGLADGTSAGPKVLIGKTTSGFFKIGTVRGSTASADYKYSGTPTSLTVGTTYFFVLKYDFSTSTSSVYINPTLDGTEPTSPEISDAISATIRTKLSNLWVREQGTVVTNSTVSGARVSSSWAEAVASTAYVPPVSAALPAPAIGTASNLASRGFTAAWTPVDNAVGYTVKVYWGTTFVDSTNVSGQSASNLAISKLVPGLTYTYKVLVRGNGSSSLDSPLSTSSTAFTLLAAAISTNNKLKIILKLDDFSVKTSIFLASPVWDYLIANKIKGGAGAIANRFDNTATALLAPYITAINSVGDTLMEVWHHGYDHVNPEFSGTSYDYQKSHFDQATQLIKSLLGIQMHSFGTPYNASDANTNTVISEDPNFKVMMFSSVIPSSPNGVTYLDNRVNMENGTGVPQYSYFVTNYNNYKNTYTDYMILQGHPNYYTLGSSTLDQLKLIVQFLIYEGVEFVRPYDYQRSLTLYAPSNLAVTPMASDRFDLTWTDNALTEYNYKIERSTDNVNWSLVGTCGANSTSYSDTSIPSVGTYYYRVYANCGIKSDYSNVVTTNNLTVSFLKSSITDQVKVSVISFNGYKIVELHCNLLKSGSVKFDLFNVQGKLINSKSVDQISAGYHQLNYPLSNIQSGVYLCRISTPTSLVTKKINIK